MRIYHKLALLFLVSLFLQSTICGQEHYNPEANPETRTIRVNLPFLEGTQEIEVQVIDGMAVFEGCIVLGEIEQFTGRGGAIALGLHTFWKDGIMPYEIENSHPRNARIMSAIQHINSTTNLRIQPRNGERDYIRFISVSSGCATNGIGRANGVRLLRISNNCSMGTIVHEIGHSLGLYHEQTRQDRDSYVTIDISNIKPNWRGQFRKYTARPDYTTLRGMDVLNYDYGSIMHYHNGVGGTAAIDNTQPTIIPLQSGVTIGQRTGLRTTDKLTFDLLVWAGTQFGNANPTTGSSPDDIAGDESDDFDEEETWQMDDNTSFNIQYEELELVPQQSGMSCWAAGAAMLVGWRDRVSIDPSEIANGTGYWAQYHSGLNANDTGMFEHWHLDNETPQTYTVQGIVQLIRRYGPLWVATHEGAAHIRVIGGISGDGTPDGTVLRIYDPWQRGMRRFRSNNTGSVYNETYTEFERKQRELGQREANEPAPYYVAHN